MFVLRRQNLRQVIIVIVVIHHEIRTVNRVLFKHSVKIVQKLFKWAVQAVVIVFLLN